MANMAVDDVIQITYRGAHSGQRILMVLHARCSAAAPAPAAELSVLADLAGKLADPADLRLIDLLACVGPEYSITAVRCQKIKPVRTIYQEVGGGGTGTFVGQSSTPNVAASIEKQSTHVGRSGIGRVQLCGIPNAVYSAGVLEGAYKNGVLDTFANRLIGSFTGGTLYPGYEFTWCLPAGGADHTYDIYDTIPQDTVRTMHRRTVRVGE